MFGAYRFILAFMVAVSHLGGLMVLGAYAVFVFLMTLILQRSYGYSHQGRLRYALNRCLRISPIYWLACVLTLVLIASFGEAIAENYHHHLHVPQDMISWLSNVLLVFSHDSEPRLTPPSWVLTVELFFYICIGLGLSKTKMLTLVWFALSVIYTLYINILEMNWVHKYFFISAASLPFATGAMLFHFREHLLQYIPVLGRPFLPALIFVCVLVNYVVAHEADMLRGYAFYVNFILNTLVIAALLHGKSGLLIPNTIDRCLGALSYPIYLIHWQVGLLFVGMGLSIQVGTLSFFFICAPSIIFFSWLIARYIEMPIERIRNLVKEKL